MRLYSISSNATLLHTDLDILSTIYCIWETGI